MKIVVLDGYNKNPGDLSWEKLEKMGDVTIYDYTDDKDLDERIGDAEIVLTNKVKINRETMDRHPALQYIGVTATGYDPVDCEAAKEKGIVVTNVPVYGTASVSQHAFAMLLEITNRVALHNESVHAGDWVRSREFCYWKAPLHEIAGLTMVVIGYGRIGQTTGAIAKAFGMNVIAVDAYQNPAVTDPYMSLEEALPLADVVVLHCVLNAENRGMINKDTIALMKPGVILINCARGPLVNEPDLVDGLKSGKIGYACLDVISKEPMVEGSVLLDAPNCIITPHIAGCSVEGRRRLLDVSMENVQAFLNGKPENVVNG